MSAYWILRKTLEAFADRDNWESGFMGSEQAHWDGPSQWSAPWVMAQKAMEMAHIEFEEEGEATKDADLLSDADIANMRALAAACWSPEEQRFDSQGDLECAEALRRLAFTGLGLAIETDVVNHAGHRVITKRLA